jgi:hypothetical protein
VQARDRVVEGRALQGVLLVRQVGAGVIHFLGRVWFCCIVASTLFWLARLGLVLWVLN